MSLISRIEAMEKNLPQKQQSKMDFSMCTTEELKKALESDEELEKFNERHPIELPEA